jgi:hypothetical protein
MSFRILSKPKTSDNQTNVKTNRNFSKKHLKYNDSVINTNYENRRFTPIDFSKIK